MTPPPPSVSLERVFDAPRPLLPDILALHEKWRADKPAVISPEGAVTWRAFGEESNRVAHALTAAGLGPGDVVGVVMETAFATVAALAGIAKAGCVSAPINLSVSDEAIAAMLADADARAVIASASQRARVRGLIDPARHAGLTLRIATGGGDGFWSDYAAWKNAQPSHPPQVAMRAGDPFNIIYSSGTTGRPKGIVHTHQSRLDWAYDLAIALRYHAGARTLCTLGLYSNISWVMMLCTMLAGGALVLAERFEAGAFIDQVEARAVTHTALVPVQLRRILDHPDFSSARVASMQAMMSCGSPLRAELKQEVFAAFSCGVIELYGLTEGVITTLDPEDAEGRYDSVGKPLLGTDLKIIGEDGAERPAGEAGEIVSRGRIVMPGYLNRPDASREAVWRDEEGRVWLRTGDIGVLDAEGFLTIVDRKKDMILSGGQNIYPADIEAVLTTHPAVKDAAVIGAPHPEWGETPFAVVELARVPDEDLATWLNERVGRRQRVAGVAVVDELPRNPNGKILKRELRQRFGAPA